jgi:site-specific DNA-methyltransferase (adenine-specific)
MKNRNLDHKDNWGTPLDFYYKLDNEFHFNFDPCPLNHDLDLWDGLKVDWGTSNFINPPYSDKKETGYLKSSFVKKAIEESKKGNLCVLLLPNSTGTKLFHNYILPEKPEIRFVKGRLRFEGVNTFGEKVADKTGMHDSLIIIFNGKNIYGSM